MQKVTFVDRILAVIQGGDKAKLVRFEQKLQKYFSKQIQMRKEQLENLRDKIQDASEDFTDAVVNINVDQLSTTDSAESYCVTYVTKMQKKQSVITDLEDQIEVLEEEISNLKSLQAAIFEESVEESRD